MLTQPNVHRHWPIGLLYDFYTALDPSKDDPPSSHSLPSSTNPTASTHSEDDDPEAGSPKLPWIITLRFRDYPTEHLMSLDSPHALHDAFINAVKEADFARNGTAKAVMSLSRADSTQLWQSIEAHSFEPFWQVMEKLLGSSNSVVKSVPVKIYNPETGQVILAAVPVRQINTPRMFVLLFVHDRIWCTLLRLLVLVLLTVPVV